MEGQIIGLINGISSQIVNTAVTEINQTITNVTNQVTSGIKSIVPQNGNELVFTLGDDSTITLVLTGLSSNDYTTLEKNKLALLNSSILSLFTYVDGDLLFNGNLVENNKLDLSNYYTKIQIDNLLNNKANLSHNHSIVDISNLQTELNNKVNIDGTKVLSQNDFTDLYKQKVDSMTNNSKYIGLFPTLTERDEVTDLATGYWCTINIDSSQSNKRTKYYYDGVQWIFDGIYQESSFGIDDNSVDSTSDGWSASKLVNELALKADKDESIDLTSIQGDILPTTNGTQNIGSPTNRFSKIYVNEAMLSTNTLYIGDTPILGTNEDTIMIKADPDQSINIKTSGVGTTKVISESGVELSTSGMNANVNIQATGVGANANITSTNEVNLTAPSVNLNGNTAVNNLTVSGNLVMNNSNSAFTVEATTVRVADNIIELNKNEVGYGVTAGKSGIKINRGDADDYLLVFDETDDKFKVGTDSLLKPIATEEYVDSKDSLKVDKVTGKSLVSDSEIARLASVTNYDHTNVDNHMANNDIHVTSTEKTNLANAVTNSHTHSNKSVLDKFTEVGGQPYYNGSAIVSGESGTGVSIDDTSTTSTTETYSVNKIQSLITEVNNTNFTNANNAKSLTINAIGDNTLTTSNTFIEISNGLLAKKQNIVNALANKGIIASQSDDVDSYATKINSIVQNSTIKNTKLNKTNGSTYQVVLTNPTTLQNISTSVLEYQAGTTGVVRYDCAFNNADSTSFNTTTDQHLIFDGMMKQDNNIKAITMTNEGTIDTYNVYSASLDKSSFYKVNSITEATVSSNEVLTISGTYNPTLVKAIGDISLTGIDKISSITWTASATNTSKLLLIYSIDSGVTWKGYDSTNHIVLDITNINDLSEVQSKGINITNLNAFSQTDLDNIRNGSPKIRFAYYFEKNSINDTLQNDSITLTVDMEGEDVFSSHYTVAFDGVKTLTYTFNANNTYTIIYTDNN